MEGQIIDLEGKEIIYKRVESTFKQYFTDEEKKELLREYYSPNLINGGVTRLEGVKERGNKLTLTISKSNYFDKVTTNFLLMKDITKLKGKIREKVEEFIFLAHTDEEFRNVYLNNGIGISILVHNKKEEYILTRRTQNVSIFKGRVSVSASGGYNIMAYKQDDPTRYIVKAELEEELGLIVSDDSINASTLYYRDEDYQPHILVDVCTEFNRDSLWGEDTQFEVSQLSVVPKQDLLKMINQTKPSPMVKYHIEQQLQTQKVGSKVNV